MAIYRVPVKKVYNRKRAEGDPTWDDIYAKVKCQKCREKIKPGEVYRTSDDGRKFFHVDCQMKITERRK